MATVVTWNVGRGQNEAPIPLIAELLVQEKADIAVLCEAGPRQSQIMTAWRDLAGAPIVVGSIAEPAFSRPVILARKNTTGVVELKDHDRATVCEVTFDGHAPILLVGVHGKSTLHATDLKKREYLGGLREHIEAREAARGHFRTMVVGDLNADPFEAPLTDPKGLDAVCHRDLALDLLSSPRRVTPRRVFINCSWTKYEAGPNRAGATYYHDDGPGSRYWHMYDQFLVRPDLCDEVSDDAIRIVSSVGSTRLVSGWRIGPTGSDHLPVACTVRHSRGPRAQ